MGRCCHIARQPAGFGDFLPTKACTRTLADFLRLARSLQYYFLSFLARPIYNIRLNLCLLRQFCCFVPSNRVQRMQNSQLTPPIRLGQSITAALDLQISNPLYNQQSCLLLDLVWRISRSIPRPSGHVLPDQSCTIAQCRAREGPVTRTRNRPNTTEEWVKCVWKEAMPDSNCHRANRCTCSRDY